MNLKINLIIFSFKNQINSLIFRYFKTGVYITLFYYIFGFINPVRYFFNKLFITTAILLLNLFIPNSQTSHTLHLKILHSSYYLNNYK